MLESIHTQTHTNTNTHTTWPDNRPTKYGADSRRGGALLIREGRLAPTPSNKLHLCRDLPRRSYMNRHRQRRCACSASHVDVDQLTSFSYCRFVSLFRTLSCIRRKSRTTPARSSRRRSRRAESASPCPSATARWRSPASFVRDVAGAGAGRKVATTPGGNMQCP